MSKIEYREGDIFASECEAWVNPVNCIGIMGAGLALGFKQRFPAIFDAYKNYCDCGLLDLGGVFCWNNDSPPPAVIFCAATKIHYRDRSTSDTVIDCLENLAVECVRLGVRSVAIPALGCGLGGLAWETFHEACRDAEYQFGDVKVVVYRPYDNG